jgi:hypothetical protein
MKKDKLTGQLPLGDVEQALEDEIRKTNRPAGMPPLSEIKTEVAKLGLSPADAEAIYDVWLSNGFKFKNGQKVRDFRATIRTWHRNEWFPSQRKAAKSKPVDNKERMRAMMERMQSNDRNRSR